MSACTRNKVYVVASCKEWHRSAFDEFSKNNPKSWEYVTSTDELYESLKVHNPRYIFFLHWNWAVSKEIFERYECVCFHMTDVPYGRGGSPLQNLIMSGREDTQLSALRMVEELDAGPVYAKQLLSLEGRAEAVYKRAGLLCFGIIRWMINAEPEPVPQTGGVTLFKRRTPAQSELPTSGSMKDLYDHIRMLDAPTYPSAFLEYGDFIFELTHASLVNDEIHAQVVLRSRESKSRENK